MVPGCCLSFHIVESRFLLFNKQMYEPLARKDKSLALSLHIESGILNSQDLWHYSLENAVGP